MCLVEEGSFGICRTCFLKRKESVDIGQSHAGFKIPRAVKAGQIVEDNVNDQDIFSQRSPTFSSIFGIAFNQAKQVPHIQIK